MYLAASRSLSRSTNAGSQKLYAKLMLSRRGQTGLNSLLLGLTLKEEWP
jgi:hypothetical protein